MSDYETMNSADEHDQLMNDWFDMLEEKDRNES